MRRRLPAIYYNALSIAGTVVAAVALFMFVFLYVIASLSGLHKTYEGIVIFMVIPAFLILGLLLIPLGMVRTARRLRKAAPERPAEPIVDLRRPENRRAFVIFLVGTLAFLFLSALGSYEAYNFTDSVAFCGTLCHTVMKPEYSTYTNSPHARVACVQCHVGSGASWYVKSKLSGLYQVYATIANVYPRPIPTPIKNLRPARETCEQCHWPLKVYGRQQRLEIYYLPEETNPRWDLEMLVNTGAGNQALGFTTGIHWHVGADVRIEYVAADAKRQEIPRVILTDLESRTRTVYEVKDGSGTSAAASGPSRVMDCIDCHNRPSHIFRAPFAFVNDALASGRVDPGLPGIKEAAVEACLAKYDTLEAARSGIAAKIRSFYEKAHPEIVKDQGPRLQASIDGVVAAFGENAFPEMKARSDAYPDNIGHLSFPGCFRCHDGRHSSPSGRTISRQCDLCHAITAQGPHGRMNYASGGQSLEFAHPVDIGQEWKETPCTDCHSPG